MRRPRAIQFVLESRRRLIGALVALALVVGVLAYSLRSTSTSQPAIGLVAVQMVSPTTVFAGGQGHIIRSDDGGKSWAAQELNCASCSGPVRVADIDMLSANEGWAATSLGLFKTTDGTRWSEQPTGLGRQPVIVDFVSAQEGWLVTGSFGAGEFAGLTDTVVAHTNDGGATWTPLVSAPPEVQGLCFSSSGDGWAATKTAAFHSSDGGASWTVALEGAVAQSKQGSTTLQCTVPGEVWAEFATGSASNASAWALGIIADGGQRYTPVAAPGGAVGSILPPPFSVIDPTTAFNIDYLTSEPSLGGGVVRSSGESGQRFVVTPLVVNGAPFTPKAVAFADAGHGVLVGAGEKGRPSIYFTVDGGMTWAAGTLPGDSPVIRQSN